MYEEAVERPRNGADGVLDEAQLLVRTRGRAPPPRRRRRPSGRRDTWSSSARRSRRRARAALIRRAWRTCCRRRRARHACGPRRASTSTTRRQRVGRALDPDQPGVVPHGALECFEIRLVDEVELEPPATQHLVHEPERAAVQVGGHDDVRPGATRDGDQRVLGGHAGRERHRQPALELAERSLERRPGRVRRARVVVVIDELARPALRVGRCLMDSGDHRTERRVRRQARMDGAGRERVATTLGGSLTKPMLPADPCG